MAALSKQERRLIEVLDRQVAFDALAALVSAMRPEPVKVALGQTAVGLDASVFLRLATDVKGEDVIDYFSTTHMAPLILPGQAIQEFWNNQLHVVDTVPIGLKKKFDSFRGDLSKLDKSFGDYAAQIDAVLEKFWAEYGHVYEESTVRKSLALFEVLQKRALVPYAQRTEFQEIAAHRKRTKTPPGFRDDGDGDFFIWVDLLTGLQQAVESGQKFSRAVLVSMDRKVDWSRAGIAHPILAAEAKVLFDVPFEIWTIERLASEVAAVT